MTGSEKIRRMQIALEYGGNTHSVSDIIELLHARRARLFENEDACIVAEMHNFPQYKAVHFWLLFGELRHVLALEHEVLPWGIEQGATVATACGRPGWGRVAAPTGWRPTPNMSHFHKRLVREH
jgi:hypothetical protein